jgi:uncharacterized cupin superfamily protein
MSHEPGTVTSVGQLAHEPYPDPVAGAPAQAIVEWGAFKGVDVGVWECTPGSFADVEEDEVFVVLSGRATIDFVDPELPSIDVGPGDIVGLDQGMQTVWHVHQTMRKVYLA